MSGNLKTILYILTVAMLSFGLQSTAHAGGFYVGLGFARTTATVNSSSETDDALTALIGYTFVDNDNFLFSAELSRYDLGSYVIANDVIEADALTLAAKATLPLGPFAKVYLKGGIASIEVNINGQQFDDEKSFGGLGFDFRISDNIDIFAEYLVFDTQIDSEMFGSGVRISF